MNEVLKKIEAIGIVPVVKIDRAEDAVPLARALVNGGLQRLLSVPMRQKQRLLLWQKPSPKCCSVPVPC